MAEEMIISTTIRIEKGEEKRLSDKIIRIKSGCDIICYGTLILENCRILSREKGYAGHICGKETGQIQFAGCTFINFGNNANACFMQLEGGHARFENCTFENCVNYITFSGELIMLDCQFINCLFNTVMTRWNSKNAFCNMENIRIRNNEITAPTKNAMNNSYGQDRRILNIETPNCTISNAMILEGEAFSQAVLKHRKKHFTTGSYIHTDGVIQNLIMKNTTMSVCSTTLVQNSKFMKCISPLLTKAEDFRGRPAVKNCEFTDCTSAIQADHRTIIEACVFLSCCGNLIEQRQFSEDGGIQVQNCRFVNCTNDARETNHAFRYMLSAGASMLLFRGSKTSKTSSVTNCLIEGMVLNEGFFIATDTLYKTPDYIVSIRDCEFTDCYTNRNDYEIFKRSTFYYGTFGSEHHNPAIQVKNCIGLDEIRNDFIDDYDEFAFDEDDFDVLELDDTCSPA